MLTTLELKNCRNFAQKTFAITPRTLLVGGNGTGKTTVIEAIRLLSVVKSFRTARTEEVIRFDEPYLQVRGGFESAATIELFYGQQFADSLPKERRLTVDGTSVGLLDYLGQFPTVLFVPTDVEIVLGGPQLRRNYLDSVLWQVSRAFRQSYIELTRLLRERGRLLFLLKQNRAGLDELQPWTELLLGVTSKIQAARQALAVFLQDYLTQLPTPFLASNEVKFLYQPNQPVPAEIERQEIQLAQNLIGPHRDEIEIQFNNQLARRYSSRGQARLIIVALKAAEAAYVEAELRTAPLVLLDDILSELDTTHAEQLINFFSPTNQIVLTTLAPLPSLADWATLKL